MINDLLKTFEKTGENGLEQAVLDNYVPKSGMYFRLSDTIESMYIDSKGENHGELYDWFKLYDYYGKLVMMNKPIKNKQIHGNNMYTVFLKLENFLVGKENFNELVKDFFKGIKTENKKKKEVLEYINCPEINDSILEKNEQIFLGCYDDILSKIKNADNFENMQKKIDYVKIFVDTDINSYLQEYQRYIYPNAFCANDYNVLIDGELYGLSGANISQNSKKPFVFHKTTKFNVAFYLPLEQAKKSRMLLDWMNSQEERNGYINSFEDVPQIIKKNKNSVGSHFVSTITKNGDAVISDYDFIPRFLEELEKPFKYQVFVENNSDDESRTISRLSEIEDMVDKQLYNGYLKRNYESDIKSIKPKDNVISRQQIDLLCVSRKAMSDWFVKDDDRAVKSCIEELTRQLVIELAVTMGFKTTKVKTTKVKTTKVKTTGFEKISAAENMRVSLLKYFKIKGENEMNSGIYYDILKKIKNKDSFVQLESDDEFFFAAGQLTRYLLNQTQEEKPKYNIAEPFLRVLSVERLKEEIRFAFSKYKYAIDLANIKFNNLLSSTMEYQIDKSEKLNFDMFISGFAGKNMIYEKTEEEKNEKE